jgi:hypothetical protein
VIGVRRAALAGLLGALTLACGPATADPSAPYFPTSRPTPPAAPAVDPAAGLPVQRATTASGPVARPNPRLTPGVVASHDAVAVCQQPKRTRAAIPFSQQQLIFQAYGIPAQDTHKYALDYLVPLQLGGSTANANLWPAATRGIGYHEKQQLNARLRILVCRGELDLAQTQQSIASDWYTAWLRYGS